MGRLLKKRAGRRDNGTRRLVSAKLYQRLSMQCQTRVQAQGILQSPLGEMHQATPLMVTLSRGGSVGAGVQVIAPEPHGLRVQVAVSVLAIELPSSARIALGKPFVGIALDGEQADIVIIHQSSYLVAHCRVGLAAVRVVMV